jgi:hypothetical protein
MPDRKKGPRKASSRPARRFSRPNRGANWRRKPPTRTTSFEGADRLKLDTKDAGTPASAGRLTLALRGGSCQLITLSVHFVQTGL